MISGNLVRSPSSTQMLADILRRTVGSVFHQSPAAIGAAMLARGMAVTQAAPQHRAPPHPTCQPNEDTARLYEALYPHYVSRAKLCD